MKIDEVKLKDQDNIKLNNEFDSLTGQLDILKSDFQKQLIESEIYRNKYLELDNKYKDYVEKTDEFISNYKEQVSKYDYELKLKQSDMDQ